MGKKQDEAIYAAYYEGSSWGDLAVAYPQFSVNRLRAIVARRGVPTFDEAHAAWVLPRPAGTWPVTVPIGPSGAVTCSRCGSGCPHGNLVLAVVPDWRQTVARVLARRLRRDERAGLVRGALAAWWAALRTQYEGGGVFRCVVSHPALGTLREFTMEPPAGNDTHARRVWGAACQHAFRAWYAELWTEATAMWEAAYGPHELAEDPPMQRTTGLSTAVSPVEITVPLGMDAAPALPAGKTP